MIWTSGQICDFCLPHDGIRPPPLCMGATGYRDPPLLGRRSTSTTAPRQCLVPRIPPFIDMDSCYSTPWCHAGRVLRGPPLPPWSRIVKGRWRALARTRGLLLFWLVSFSLISSPLEIVQPRLYFRGFSRLNFSFSLNEFRCPTVQAAGMNYYVYK